jgi:hypothetical protein
MRKTILLLLAMALLFAGAASAANVTTVGSSNLTVEITGLDADWAWSTDLSGELAASERIQAIFFYPSAALDRMIVRDGGIDAATLCDSGIVMGADDPRVCYFEPPIGAEAVIDITDCTLDTAANAKVVILLEGESR